jgi:ATP-dependent Clp protease ATP-binding subunit ClpC
MPNKMERFTHRAREVLNLAQQETERLQQDSLDTQHLLFGMLVEEGGVAGRALRELGVSVEMVRSLSQMYPAKSRVGNEPPVLSADTKRVLELAVDEARRMGHHYIGTEHLLLGLARLTEGKAIEILKRSGISPEEIRRQTRRVLQESPSRPKPPEEGAPETLSSNRTNLRDYILRVTVRDAMTKEETLTFDIRLDRAQLGLGYLIRQVLQEKEVIPVEWTSDDNQIVISVEKAEN